MAKGDSGYTNEINLVSWNGAEPKYDIRSFSPDREKCGKGITLTAGEAARLLEALKNELQGDYLIPCLTLPAERENLIGVFGQRHLRYLKEYRRVTYLNLLTSGRLNDYLSDIDKQAQDMLFRLVKVFADRQGVTEQLKADNPMEWVRRLNNIRACAMEIVNSEIIYETFTNG